MKTIYEHRMKSLRKLLVDNELDCILLFSSYSDSRYLKWICDKVPLLYNYFYITKSESGVLEIDYLIENENNYEKIIPVDEEDLFSETIFNNFNRKKIGIVGLAPLEHFSKLELQPVNLTKEMDKLLLIKSEDEINKISQNAKIINNLLKTFDFKVGQNELEISKDLRLKILSEGESLAFPICVTTGNDLKDTTASFPKNKIVSKDDAICIDMGMVRNGFNSDITRMFFFKDSVIKAEYEKLLTAHNEVISQIKPGLEFSKIPELYKIALEEVNASTELEIADLGHSIGFGLHEYPFIYREGIGNPIIDNSMIFTLEPEIIYSDFRVRVEDMILVQDGVAKILTV
jgi:Xaa-Pro aminopeptidase